MKHLQTMLIASTVLVTAVHAQTATSSGMDPMKPMSISQNASAMPAADMTRAEVRKVDKDNNKITLKHGDIKNLDMPGMTMVFQVKDPALLDRVKAGDKVQFKAEKSGSALVVTEIQRAN